MEKNIRDFNNVIKYINKDIRIVLDKLPNDIKEKVEEIRLRNGSPLNINFQGESYFISKTNKISQENIDSINVNQIDINNTFQLITNHSIYAYNEEIKKGYITIPGGHRIGIGGQIIYGNNGIEDIINISSFNIRIAKEKKGISDFLIPYLVNNDSFYNTLIISPPQCGKTTLLRDLIRNLSNGNFSRKGFKISLIDERSEIAGMYKGIPQKDIGIQTDVLDGCLKAHGIMMFIRSMSPEIIALDEIGGREDIESLVEGLRAGIRFITTIHGDDFDDIKNKANLKQLFREKVFKRYLILDNSKGIGTIAKIIDGNNLKVLYDSTGDINGIN